MHAQPLHARTFPDVLIAKPDNFHDRGPCTSDRDDHRGDDEGREERREKPAGPLVSFESIPDPPHEARNGTHQNESDGYRQGEVESALRKARPHALDVCNGDSVRRSDSAERRRHALLPRPSTEITILQASVSRHDAKRLDQAIAGQPIAVPYRELLGNPDVIEEMLDVCLVAQVDP
jgi:hypothetical protein